MPAGKPASKSPQTRLKLPHASRQTTHAILLVALLAKKDRSFGQQQLRELKAVNNRNHARRVLDFLYITDRAPRNPRFNPGFLRKREEARTTRSLKVISDHLQEQLRTACRGLLAPDRTPRDLAHLGTPQLDGPSLSELVSEILDSLDDDVRNDIEEHREATRWCLEYLHQAVQFDDLQSLATAADLAKADFEQLLQCLGVSLDENGFPDTWAPKEESNSGDAGSAEGESGRYTSSGSKTQRMPRDANEGFHVHLDVQDNGQIIVSARVPMEQTGGLADLIRQLEAAAEGLRHDEIH